MKTEVGSCVLCQVHVPCRKSHYIFSKKHEKTHLGVKEYVCEVCNKAFGSSHNLRVHKIVHSGNKPFLCRTCGKSFARRAEVRDHERIHTGEKPFKCDICAMSFAQRSNLQSHKRATHLNEKRYRCEVCEKTFKRRRLLDYHTQTPEEDNVADILSRILEIPVEVGLIHSEYMCLNCELICREYAGIEIRMHRIKEEVIENYNKIISTIEYVEVPAKEEIVEEVPEEAYGDEVAIYTEEDPTERSFDYDASTQGSPQEAKEETTADAEHVMILTESTTESGNEDQENRDLCKSDESVKHESRIYTRKDNVFCCHLCPQETLIDDPTEFTMHMKGKHMQKLYICDICGMDCRRRMYLLRHLAFGSSHNLRVHKIVHSGNKPFLCRTCGKSFARRAEVRDHERIHTGEKPFKCDICAMSFAQRSNLQSHKRATHLNEKRYRCEVCEKTFKRRRLLDYHTQAAHTGERPFKCTLCPSSFVYPEHLKKHLLIHSNEKKYTCEGFNNQDNRNTHRFVHSDKKPFECVQCGQGFMRKPLLFAHMKSEGHLSDTIIVNQPQLLEHPGVGESENPNTEMTSAGRSTYIISSEEAEEQMSQIIDDISIEEQVHDVDKKNIKIE
uniref:Putative c2h2-type zn-finger protein n=1 Tax=Lutzomyia longipalpis TaxID=7200 RepID=A0A1B0GH19_LUTLO